MSSFSAFAPKGLAPSLSIVAQEEKKRISADDVFLWGRLSGKDDVFRVSGFSGFDKLSIFGGLRMHPRWDMVGSCFSIILKVLLRFWPKIQLESPHPGTRKRPSLLVALGIVEDKEKQGGMICMNFSDAKMQQTFPI